MRRPITLWILTLLVLVSAVAVVQSKHMSREMAYELQRERAERDRLNTEWVQLQLEESAWANPDRVARLAREDLGMIQPTHYMVLEAGR